MPVPFKPMNIWQLVKILQTSDYKELHVHHTWKPNHSHFNGDNHQQLQIGMYNHHTAPQPRGRGWTDIGQHITLFPDGVILTGRSFDRWPASIEGHNEGAFCMEMVGNFDKGHDVLEGIQLVQAIRISRAFYNAGKNIRFHNENSTKSCPGTSLTKKYWMDRVLHLDVENYRTATD